MAEHNPLSTPDEGRDQTDRSNRSAGQQTVTHNLDTGQDEPLQQPSPEDESTMDFAPGSGGGSAGDGAGA